MVQALWKTEWQFLKKFKTELSCDSAIPLMSIYSKELKSGLQTVAFLCSLHHYSQKPRCENNRNVNQQMNG